MERSAAAGYAGGTPPTSGSLNIIPGFRYVAWLTAVCVAGFFTLGGFRFGLMTEPDGTGVGVLLFLLCLGVASQAGLIAAPWCLSQGWAVRVIVAALMAPAAGLLAVSAWGGAQRFVAGNPISPLAWTIYLVGALVYSVAYIYLVVSKSGQT